MSWAVSVFRPRQSWGKRFQEQLELGRRTHRYIFQAGFQAMTVQGAAAQMESLCPGPVELPNIYNGDSAARKSQVVPCKCPAVLTIPGSSGLVNHKSCNVWSVIWERKQEILSPPAGCAENLALISTFLLSLSHPHCPSLFPKAL